jgi:lysophospholipase
MLLDHPLNPIPPGARSGMAICPDGTAIRYAAWVPPAATKMGTVVLMQGRAEFIEKYFETVGDLLVRGFAVVAFDWRGQGGSARQLRNRLKGHVAGFDAFEEDLETVLAQVVLPSCPSPYFALAHSTGATILLGSAPQVRRRFRRMVVLSPLIDFGRTGWPTWLAAPLARTLSAIGLGGMFIPGGGRYRAYAAPFEGNELTSEPRRYERAKAFVGAHPQVTIGAPTFAWVVAALDAMATLRKPDMAEGLRGPLLILASGKDTVVSTAATERFAGMSKGASLIVIPGARHELLQEADIYREQALAAFDAFIPGS